MPGPVRLALAALASTLLAGCAFDAFTDTIDRYGTAKAVLVRLGCEDTYEVFDRPENRTLLVRTGIVTEMVVEACGRGAPLPDRQRRIAETFLAETTNRPLCRIVGDTFVTELHREFSYSCPPALAPAVPAPGPRRG